MGRTGLLACLLVLAVGCSGGPAAQPGASPAGSTPASQPVGGQPAGAVTLRDMAADLDGDGRPEQVTAYQLDGQVRVAIAPQGAGGQEWTADLPGEAALTGLRALDLDGDERPEVLVESKGPEKDTYSLGVIRWASGRGQLLAPHGGPSQGSPLFRSRYYPPYVGDLSGNLSYQIVVSVESSSPAFLDSVVYEWDGQAYAPSALYLMPPRVVPTATP